MPLPPWLALSLRPRSPNRLEHPAKISDKISRHTRRVGVLKRQVFSCGSCEDHARLVLQFGLGFKEATAAVGDEFSGGDHRLFRPDGVKVAHVQLGTISEPFRLNGASPGHEFVQQRCRKPAMDSLLKPHMRGTENKMSLDDPSVRFRPQVKSCRIRFPAHKTRMRMR